MINPLYLYQSDIKKIFVFFSVIALGIFLSFNFRLIEFDMTISRNVLCILFLLFIPGFIFLRFLRVFCLNSGEIVLFSIGLSISIIMFVGFTINILSSILNIENPLTQFSLFWGITIFVYLVLFVTFIRDRFSESVDTNIKNIDLKNIKYLIILSFLPVLSLFGTYSQNNYNVNTILLIEIVIISLIPIIICFNSRFPKELYPYCIFICSLSLLLHRSLITNYVTGWDVNVELFYSNLVIQNHLWNADIINSVNTMLSTVIFVPTYVLLSNLDPVWVFKLVFPLIFSFVPVGLYSIFKSQFNEKVAILSCFFFIFLMTFYGEMISLPRQQIAELFLILIMFTFFSEKNYFKQNYILPIIFGLSLIVSHYGLCYIFIIIIIISYIITKLSNKIDITLLGKNIFKNTIDNIRSNKEEKDLRGTYIALILIFTFVWYIYTSNMISVNHLVNISDHLVSNFYSDLFNPDSTQGLDLIITGSSSQLHTLTKYVHYISQFLIILGFLISISIEKKYKISGLYLTLSFACLCLLFASIAIPNFSYRMQTTRIYQITLIFLAPYFVIGGISIISIIKKPFINKYTLNNLCCKIVSIFLIGFLLLNSGFFYEIYRDSPTSISLNNDLNYPYFTDKEVISNEWLYIFKMKEQKIFADQFNELLFWGRFGKNNGILNSIILYSTNGNKYQLRISDGDLIYLGRGNIKNNVYNFISNGNSINPSFYNQLLSEDTIYANGDSKILFRSTPSHFTAI